MKTTKVAAAVTGSLLAIASVSLTVPQAGAQPASRPSSLSARDRGTRSDVITPAWKTRYDNRTRDALKQRLRTGGRGQAERLRRGVYGRVSQTGKDRIFVVLAEFGNTRHSAVPDDPDSGAQRFDGPLHNQIPRPNRTQNNSTLWRPDYNRGYYRNLYFNRMRDFYADQSSGAYSINGDVTEWVKVPFNEARYGTDSCGDIVCSNVWFLVRDALSIWVNGKVKAGWSHQRITDYLKTFDVQDRYDYDGDGDFREPDGYIDHFQIVHAGGDEADGDPVYGTDAIWSHRGNVGIHPNGTGPGPAIGGIDAGEGGISDPNGAKVKLPDHPTGIWVSDYTMQPENGGLSVFAHEYAHDLGLPDEYDTSGNTGGAENSTGFWTLMSQSRGTAPGDPGIGDRPMPMNGWDKFQLGWLQYNVVHSGRVSSHRLRPAQRVDGRNPNGLIVLLPDKSVTFQFGEPCADCGERFFYSGRGDNLDNTMTRDVSGGGTLTARVRYDTEEGFDYAFLEASSDHGETWTPLQNSQSYTGEDQGTFNGSHTGISGSSQGQWVDLTATVPAGTNALRWRYLTDPGTTLTGFQVDNITLNDTLIGGAETNSEGWALNGFEAVHATETKKFLNAYFVDNRQYLARDTLLRHVYNFGFNNIRKVEFFKYDPGAVISYWDTSFTDNNVGDHPGGGEILPIDAHPVFSHAPDGTLLRPRTLTYDSAFSRKATTRQVIHYQGNRVVLKSHKAVPLFDDTLDWWYNRDEHTVTTHPGRYQPGWYSVDVPKTGTTIRVVKVDKSKVMTVRVGTSR